MSFQLPQKTASALRSAFLCLLLAIVSGKAMAYDNPLITQRADPWVVRHTDGYYYFVATVPEYDRIELRRSRTVQGLASARAEVIWRKHASGQMGAHIWAPELHWIDDAWYIYFAAGEVERPWHIRMYALRNTSAVPTEGDWEEMGRITTPHDTFSLDATSFSHKGKRYLLWAQSDPESNYNSALLLAEMESPTRIKEPVVTLTKPELDWETVGYKVNEGAAVLQKNGRVFVTYSASATDHNYAVGLLWADEDADLLDPDAWHKSPQPVFHTNPEVKRFGPGHNSFTVAEDGVTDLMVYHARDYREIEGDPLNDPNRHTRVRVLHWDKNGMPDFRQEKGD
ncbi:MULTISPECIES: glycoside hydrolase family 43 protein [unclassified Microbulbifer]|uniref:glycoside hydrolase family 43 protein n=1 Tax=unclassified Microbulbifer TaxID=2619833 RepID=UPI0027E3DC29|nr:MULTISPECIES: glycoside hydrolase family 43 protein [unclassified Microbulbifer]